MLILGIETSCDETGIALYHSEQGIVAQQLYSQIKIHQEYGGVVPELASRDHIRKTMPLIQKVLKQANYQLHDLTAIAYTAGPGLIGALLIGASIGRSLAYALKIPAIPIHHMEGHLVAPFLEYKTVHYPHLALLVSGGHSLLILAKAFSEYEILGRSIDDAAGEAFDKTAKLLGLDYPGGPQLAKLATTGRAGVFQLPRPMIHRQDYDFSFSGLKTAVLHAYQQSDQSAQTKADLAYEFQQAITDVLVAKAKRAIMNTGCKQFVISGGVSANQVLRSRMQQQCDELQCQLYLPSLEYCTDNGAMIAYCGFLRLQQGSSSSDLAIQVKPRWPLNDLKL